LLVAAVPIGLLIYSSVWIGDQQGKAKDENLKPLTVCPDSGSGHKREVPDGNSSGKKIVFASGPQPDVSSDRITSDNPGHPSTGMYVINTDGSGLTHLTSTTAAEFGIPNSLLLDDWEIESIISHDSSVAASAGYGEQSVCSPDGKKQASVTTTAPEASDDDSSAPPADTDISVRTSAGTTDLGDPAYDYTKESSPIFSPDSEKMVYMKGSQVYVANADGSDQTQLADDMRYTATPTFSPNSKKVAFVTDTPGGPDSTDLYVIDVDATDLTHLTHNTKRFGEGYSIQEHIHEGGGILFSPDSKKIAFVLYQIVHTPYTPSGHRDVRVPVRYDMYVENVDGTGLTRLTHTEAQEEHIITWVGG
jgi:Tol biopolymer transport system component